MYSYLTHNNSKIKLSVMRWTGTKKKKEAFTNDGYHLRVKSTSNFKYIWSVYYRGRKIKNNETKSNFKTSLASAKRQAIVVMIHHMFKK
ncbi:MAG: hypothetical protein AB8B65_17820 [Kordia sp.]